MTGDEPRISAFGDGAVLVELGDEVGIRLARRARLLAGAVEELRAAGTPFGPPVPGAASVLVPFDPLDLTPGQARTLLMPLVGSVPRDPGAEPAATEHPIPVSYGGADGPDLEPVARELGLDPAEVVAIHSGTAYEVLFLGFAPGFAYLGELPERIVVPRLATPRTHVAAGSVAIAGRFSGIYPQRSAGGWRLIGRTDVPLFDPASEPPERFRPGDRVRFVPR